MLHDAIDHRVLGQQLDLFHFQEEAPGMVFWHPRGYAMYRALENAVRAWTASAGFEEVKTPELMRSAIWEQSGHWENFRQHMFAFSDEGQERSAEASRTAPGTCRLIKKRSLAQRDLPLRLSELRHRAPRRIERRAARALALAAIHPRRRARLSG